MIYVNQHEYNMKVLVVDLRDEDEDESEEIKEAVLDYLMENYESVLDEIEDGLYHLEFDVKEQIKATIEIDDLIASME